MKQTEKQSVDYWNSEHRRTMEETGLPGDFQYADIERHKKELEANPLAWMKFFFPRYATAEFAKFQKKYIRRVIDNPEWYEVLSWARELGKDTVTMMAMIYLNLTGKKKFTIFVSSSYDAACDLLMPYMVNYQSNQRIKAYYGEQKQFGTWEIGDFTTTCGARYVALGAGQSPRGKKNEELRPDSIICTDLDTDEDCRNKDTIDKRFDWVEKALYFTRSMSKPLLFILLGNMIAKDCCVVRAAKKANHHDVVNIRMVKIGKPDPVNDYKYGKSVWPEKNTEEMIDNVLSKVSFKAGQQECFNNPISEGDVFKEVTFGKVPSLKSFRFLVAYADPAASNNIKERSSSTKALWLVGMLGANVYIIKGFLDRVVNDEFVNWFYYIRDFVKEQTQTRYYIENNTLQNPFYEQVFKPLFLEKGKESGHYIGITPDTRKKPDKYSRVEGNLEPVNRAGRLIFNIAEKDDPHMQRLVDQFKLFNEKMKSPADGPDAIEGAYYILNQKHQAVTSDDVKVFKKRNTKRV